MENKSYVPALRFHWLTNAYDTLLALTFPERKIKNDLLRFASIQKEDKVLDFGVGTATLSIMAFEMQPDANFFGVDIDPKILSIAGKKIRASNAKITIQEYDGANLPYAGGYFDAVMSCLVFHHLTTLQKHHALEDINRVLKPGGSLMIADFGKSRSTYAKVASKLFSWFDGVENTSANEQGLLPKFIAQAGFDKVTVIATYDTAFGTVEIFRATKQ